MTMTTTIGELYLESAAKEAADTNRVTANATPDKIDFMGNLPRDSGNEI